MYAVIGDGIIHNPPGPYTVHTIAHQDRIVESRDDQIASATIA